MATKSTNAAPHPGRLESSACKKNTPTSKLAGADAPIVAQSYLTDHDYAPAYYAIVNSLDLADDEMDLHALETCYDEDGLLVDHVGFDAYGVRCDYQVEHYNYSFYSATHHNL